MIVLDRKPLRGKRAYGNPGFASGNQISRGLAYPRAYAPPPLAVWVETNLGGAATIDSLHDRAG